MPEVVIGAGMVGCATALALIKRGFEVVIYEKRPDPRLENNKDVGRSINLAISSRGLRSLRAIDPKICDEVVGQTVPMSGRMLHMVPDGELVPVQYGITGTESINSISRSLLNNILIEAAERAGAKIVFDYRVPVDLSEIMKLGRTVFGCDGAFSKVRTIVEKNTDFNLQMETVSTYYMEVPIKMSAAVQHWPQNYLHIWPRGSHMFIALPNKSGSFTGTLFAPKTLFDHDLVDPEALAAWFQKEFPDAAGVIGAEGLRDLGQNAPRGKLTSIKFFPYNISGKVILLGDASHSMVPFYGQGLNAGLEDVRILFEDYIDKYSRDDWNLAFDEYSRFRKVDLDAINDLSMENYLEMCSTVTKKTFALRKFVDNSLSRILGDKWLPLYTMVSFRDDVRYSEALSRAREQDRIIRGATSVVVNALGIATSAALVYLWRRNRNSI